MRQRRLAAGRRRRIQKKRERNQRPKESHRLKSKPPPPVMCAASRPGVATSTWGRLASSTACLVMSGAGKGGKAVSVVAVQLATRCVGRGGAHTHRRRRPPRHRGGPWGRRGRETARQSGRPVHYRERRKAGVWAACERALEQRVSALEQRVSALEQHARSLEQHASADVAQRQSSSWPSARSAASAHAEAGQGRAVTEAMDDDHAGCRVRAPQAAFSSAGPHRRTKHRHRPCFTHAPHRVGVRTTAKMP